MTANPVFVDAAGANYRLASGSPVVNRGTNAGWMTTAQDLEGQKRLDPWMRQVDMGAYELLLGGTMAGIR